MANPVIKPSDISIADKLLVAWPTIAVSVIPMVGWLYVQQQFCPSDALLAGYVETTIGAVGAFFITVIVCAFIFLGLMFKRRAQIQMRRPRAFRIICIVLASLTLALWGYILSSYACVDEKGFSLHSNPFEKPATYDWSDIRSATPICKERGRRAIVHFLKLKLEMKDGNAATLGFPESRILPHHAELKANLRQVPRSNDYSASWPCPDDYRDLFARR